MKQTNEQKQTCCVFLHVEPIQQLQYFLKYHRNTFVCVCLCVCVCFFVCGCVCACRCQVLTYELPVTRRRSVPLNQLRVRSSSSSRVFVRHLGYEHTAKLLSEGRSHRGGGGGLNHGCSPLWLNSSLWRTSGSGSSLDPLTVHWIPVTDSTLDPLTVHWIPVTVHCSALDPLTVHWIPVTDSSLDPSDSSLDPSDRSWSQVIQLLWWHSLTECEQIKTPYSPD